MNTPAISLLARRILLALLLAIALILIVQSSAKCQTESTGRQTPTLTASGDGEVRLRPDTAIVRLGVVTEAPTAAEAREQNAQKAAKVVEALKALRIPESDIQTSAFQIYPVRRFEDETQRGEPPIVGYRVSNIVTVRTGQLDLAPKIIDDAIAAGANEVESVDFTLRDENAPRQTALRQAVSNARENARVMATELGVQLVRVQSVQQGGLGVIPPPFAFGRAGVAEVATPTPILPGEVTVNASVTLTYAIR